MAEPEDSNLRVQTAYWERKVEIDQLLEQLLAYSREHLNRPSEEIHWGHVGDLADWLVCLRRVAKVAGSWLSMSSSG